MKEHKEIRVILVSAIIISIFISSTLTIEIISGLDIEPPTITINFAGNLGEKGGPIWRPPDEGTPLIGRWGDGYYTNDSRQSEDWIYINLTVSDYSNVEVVWLQWLNQTTWTNWEYKFTHTIDDYYEINTSDHFKTSPGFDYSFNIVANDSFSNSRTICWNKIGANGNKTRRYVQLNCNNQEISYMPLYLHESEYLGDSGVMQDDDDRLHHDQGPPCGDTGYLTKTLPGSKIEYRTCGAVIGYWYDESLCINPFKIKNIYFHFWWSTSDSTDMNIIGWDKTRTSFENNRTMDSRTAFSSNSRSKIYYYGPTGGKNYYLNTFLLGVTETSFTENDIYELVIKFRDSGGNPTVICNRSIMSFILINVPDNNTLNSTYIDSDMDGLTDWQELYVSFTSPFLLDTDMDGMSDYHEYNSGTDSNDFNDYYNSKPNKPNIKGPIIGKIGREYEYTFYLSDPDKDKVYLKIDWDNEKSDEIYGPYESGTNVKFKHIWDKKGNYLMRAKIIDFYNLEGEWSTLEVSIPTNKINTLKHNLIYLLFERCTNIFPFLRYLMEK